MHDVSEHRFSFTLDDLPRGKFVKLSDALNLAFYGGVPSIRYEGTIPLSAVEDGGLSMGEDEWMLNTDDGPIQGPKLGDVARPGAILFGIEDRSKPNPAQQSEDKPTELALAPASRQYGPDAGLPFWKAELVRHHGGFCSKLSLAARSGDVRLMGIPVEAPWALEPSTFDSCHRPFRPLISAWTGISTSRAASMPLGRRPPSLTTTKRRQTAGMCRIATSSWGEPRSCAF